MTMNAGGISTLHMRSITFLDLFEQLTRNHERDACDAAVRAFHLRLVAEAGRTSVVPAVLPALDGVITECVDALRFHAHNSVLRRDHDGVYARCLRRIVRICRPVLKVGVVIVDLPEQLPAAKVKGAEV